MYPNSTDSYPSHNFATHSKAALNARHPYDQVPVDDSLRTMINYNFQPNSSASRPTSYMAAQSDGGFAAPPSYQPQMNPNSTVGGGGTLERRNSWRELVDSADEFGTQPTMAVGQQQPPTPHMGSRHDSWQAIVDVMEDIHYDKRVKKKTLTKIEKDLTPASSTTPSVSEALRRWRRRINRGASATWRGGRSGMNTARRGMGSVVDAVYEYREKYNEESHSTPHYNATPASPMSTLRPSSTHNVYVTQQPQTDGKSKTFFAGSGTTLSKGTGNGIGNGATACPDCSYGRRSLCCALLCIAAVAVTVATGAVIAIVVAHYANRFHYRWIPPQDMQFGQSFVYSPTDVWLYIYRGANRAVFEAKGKYPIKHVYSVADFAQKRYVHALNEPNLHNYCFVTQLNESVAASIFEFERAAENTIETTQVRSPSLSWREQWRWIPSVVPDFDKQLYADYGMIADCHKRTIVRLDYGVNYLRKNEKCNGCQQICLPEYGVWNKQAKTEKSKTLTVLRRLCAWIYIPEAHQPSCRSMPGIRSCPAIIKEYYKSGSNLQANNDQARWTHINLPDYG